MPVLSLAPSQCRVALLLGNPELGKNERVVERHLTEEGVPARSPAMPCGHVDPEQERVRVRLQRAQLSDVLGGLPIQHLTGTEPGPHQERRKGLLVALQLESSPRQVLLL